MKIRVNTICPGIFPSEMTGTTSGSYTYDMPDAPTKAALRSTMRGLWLPYVRYQTLTAERPGKPEEIVAPIIMLSSRGGMYMNNAHLTVDGGRLMVSLYGNNLKEEQTRESRVVRY
jgi:NAD(P)-dependent dehydrogenase (short-subunit alcohol dehydrogenase family)